MSDDDQNTNPPITDSNSSDIDTTTNDSESSGAEETHAAVETNNTDELSAADAAKLDAALPDFSELEYATPSAYIDPDLPTTPTSIEDPNEPAEPEQAPEEDVIEMTPEQIAEIIKTSNATMAQVAEKIANSRNILIALSGDPTVDELTAAICLSLFLDRLGKHAIAIYSGTTPNALEFLKPEGVFENNADVLQDFVVAISKDKADHIRYKLDGDFVKVFITPYRDRIAAEDLDFSYGDYNVDLVLALNVNNGVDLDSALREYGRIMHDATVINITTGNPGKFGEIEWSNRHASSVSEMIANLLLSADGDTKINAEEATALLTGIIAATDRFARANTYSTTMQIASKLLDYGADQQLIAANISDDLDNQFFNYSDSTIKAKKSLGINTKNIEGIEKPSFSFESTKAEDDASDDDDDDTTLKISHQEDQSAPDSASTTDKTTSSSEPEATNTTNSPNKDNSDESTDTSNAPDSSAGKDDKNDVASTDNAPTEDPALLNELKTVETNLSGSDPNSITSPLESTQPDTNTSTNGLALSTPAPETVITPSNAELPGATQKYSQMLEDALAEPATSNEAPMDSTLPPVMEPTTPANPDIQDSATPIPNEMPSDQVLPPPPAPPIDINSPMPMPAPIDMPPVPESASTPEPTPAPESAPMPEPTPAPTPEPDSNIPDSSAFTIPGM